MRFDAGFVKVPRWWWTALEKAPAAWAKVWVFVAMEANISPRPFEGRTIQPGQLVTSVAKLARECGVTVDQTRAALRAIQKANAGTIETTSKYSVITLFESNGCGDPSLMKSQTESQTESQALSQTNPKREPNNKKNREGRIERGAKFSPPTPAEVSAYGAEMGFQIDGDRFCDFYASKGWIVGKSPMKDWRAAVRSWKARDASGGSPGQPAHPPEPEPEYHIAEPWVPGPEEDVLFALTPSGEVNELPKPATEEYGVN